MTIFPPSRIPAQAIGAIEGQSLSYADYEGRSGVTGDRLRRSRATVRFTDEEIAAIAAIGEPLRIFALVDEWCPDVVVNLPIVAGAVRGAPFLSLFVLPRPDQTAFAAAYPGPDIAHSRIPTYVIIDAQNRERGVLIERPADVSIVLKPHIEKLYAEIQARFPGIERTALPADVVAELTADGERHRAALADLEREGIVEWLLRCADAG